jgi:hypothetical protein
MSSRATVDTSFFSRRASSRSRRRPSELTRTLILHDGLPPFLLDEAARIRRATSSRILASYLPNRCSLARSSNARVGSTASASAIAASRPIAEVNEIPSARQHRIAGPSSVAQVAPVSRRHGDRLGLAGRCESAS